MIFTLITSPSENPSESPLKSPKKPKKAQKNNNTGFPVFLIKNRTEPNRNRSVWTGSGSVWIFKFFKIWFWLVFWVKTEPNRICSPLFNIPVILSSYLPKTILINTTLCNLEINGAMLETKSTKEIFK